MDKMGGLTSIRDEQTMTQYAWGDTGMVSYDDERAICDKTEYAQVHNLNGYIIWELSGDLMPDKTTPLLDAANAKLLKPDLDCASFDLSDDVASNVIGDVFQDSSEPKIQFYPSFDTSTCLHEGSPPGWMKKADIFGDAEVSPILSSIYPKPVVQILCYNNPFLSIGVRLAARNTLVGALTA